MKQLELNLQKRLLIVEAPHEYVRYSIYDRSLAFYTKENNLSDIKGSYKLICKGFELTEEIAKGLVNPFWDYYKNYLESDNGNVGNYKRFVKRTALESFISAIEAENNYWGENPLGSEPRSYSEVIDGVSIDELRDDLESWQVYENQTFKLDQTLIFEIL